MNNSKIFIIVILLVGGLAFFWFAIRPSQIKKACIQKAQAETGQPQAQGSFDVEKFLERKGLGSDKQKLIDDVYKNCLREKGL